MVILDYRESKRGSATYILDGICTSETGIISNGRTDTRIDSVWEINVSPLTCGVYEYCISETHSTGVISSLLFINIMNS